MTPFQPAELPPESFDPQYWVTKSNCSLEQATIVAEEFKRELVYMNDIYQVHVRDNHPYVLHLSIKRRDKEPIHDWRDLQEIKNMIVGPENEAVELYPAESRLVDYANQFHLWVLKDPSDRFPFGFNEGRKIGTPEEAALVGAKQRPFPKG